MGAVVLPARSALAINVDGKFGVGFETTLSGLDGRLGSALQHIPDVRPAGFAMRYYAGNVGIEGIVGATFQASSGTPAEFAGFLSVGVLYNVFRAPNVNLSLGVRAITAVARTNTAGVSTGSRIGFAAEIPLRVEYFFGAAFAISAAVGPVLNVPVTSDVDPLTGNTSSLDISLTRGEYSGGLGFTYYFN